jgi:hypothetical protein
MNLMMISKRSRTNLKLKSRLIAFNGEPKAFQMTLQKHLQRAVHAQLSIL